MMKEIIINSNINKYRYLGQLFMVIFILFTLITNTYIDFPLSDIYGCRTFRDLWGASKCPTFFSKFDSEYFSLIIFFEIFIYFAINSDFFHHNDTFRKK